uniref:GRF-type domain-containing protein n=1 Tax=Lactuca sativa TaxID=4236 RepID=A0A9R1WSG0_LACSA|nr:hypothetical protein LSAT_V11C900500970 [Lactuca sativa]
MVLCFCGKFAVVKCSWTPKNPGRRFYACPQKVKKFDSACRFIGWVDPPMCERSKVIILGLLRNINRMQAWCTALKIMLLASWVFFVILFIRSV